MLSSFLPKWPALLALAWLGLSSSPAHAEDEAATADALFREGKQLAARGDWGAACPRFAEGHRLRPKAAGILLNLADCEERVGQLVTALSHFREASSLIGPDDPRTSMVDGRVSVLERRLVQVTFKAPAGFPPDALVDLDGVHLSREGLGTGRFMNPGVHRLTVRASGRADANVVLTFREGASLTVELPIGEVPSEPRPGEPSPGSATTEPTPDVRIPIGITVGVLGLVGVGVAIATGVMVGSEQDAVDQECDAATRRCSVEGLDAAESGQTLLVLNAVATGVGIVGVGAGAALLITALVDADDDDVGLTVQSTRVGTTVGLRGRF